MDAAARAYGANRPDEAARLCRSILIERPTELASLLLLGTAEHAMRQVPAACRRFRRALRTAPGAGGALRNLTFAETDPARVLVVSRAALLAAPDDARIALTHATRRHAAGLGGVRGLARWMRRLAPDDADVWAMHGGEALQRGEHEAAERSFHAAVMLQPRRGDLLYRLGRVCVFRMRHDAAARAFARSLRVTPDDRTARQWHRLSTGWAAKRVLRMAVAARWLEGDGIEIGAMHEPLELPDGARARYVDYLPLDEQRRRNPELDRFALVPSDLLDDGERLNSLPDGSLDFIVANHFLEHCEDPLGTLAHHAAKLRPGGILFYAVPRAVNLLDRKRAVTTLDHVVTDSRDGGAGTRQQHYREVARLTFGLDGEEADRRADVMMRERQTIHFHVWDAQALRAVIELAARHSDPPLELREFVEAGEMIVVLQAARAAVSSPPP